MRKEKSGGEMLLRYKQRVGPKACNFVSTQADLGFCCLLLALHGEVILFH